MRFIVPAFLAAAVVFAAPLAHAGPGAKKARARKAPRPRAQQILPDMDAPQRTRQAKQPRGLLGGDIGIPQKRLRLNSPQKLSGGDIGIPPKRVRAKPPSGIVGEDVVVQV